MFYGISSSSAPFIELAILRLLASPTLKYDILANKLEIDYNNSESCTFVVYYQYWIARYGTSEGLEAKQLKLFSYFLVLTYEVFCLQICVLHLDVRIFVCGNHTKTQRPSGAYVGRDLASMLIIKHALVSHLKYYYIIIALL